MTEALEVPFSFDDKDAARALENINKRLAELEQNAKKASGGTDRLASSWDGLAKIASGASRLLTTGLQIMAAETAALTAAIGISVKAASDWESAFAGVKKTVEATPEEFAAIEAELRNIAKTSPLSAIEIARVAENAGALGIQKDQIASFSKTMVELGITTNLTAEEASTSLAQLNAIVSDGRNNFDRLGATIVALGNAGASTETQIVELALRMAGAGENARMSQAEIVSWASAIASVGINAEAGGSAFTRTIMEMGQAVDLGGKKLEGFAKIASRGGVADFQKLFKEDASAAFEGFIKGLADMRNAGENVSIALAGLGIKEIRQLDLLNRLSAATEQTSAQLRIGERAVQANSALVAEVGKRYATFESQMLILKNRLFDVSVTVGDAFIPALKVVGSVAAEMIAVAERIAPALAANKDTFAALAQVVADVVVPALKMLLPIIAATVDVWATEFATLMSAVSAYYSVASAVERLISVQRALRGDVAGGAAAAEAANKYELLAQKAGQSALEGETALHKLADAVRVAGDEGKTGGEKITASMEGAAKVASELAAEIGGVSSAAGAVAAQQNAANETFRRAQDIVSKGLAPGFKLTAENAAELVAAYDKMIAKEGSAQAALQKGQERAKEYAKTLKELKEQFAEGAEEMRKASEGVGFVIPQLEEGPKGGFDAAAQRQADSLDKLRAVLDGVRSSSGLLTAEQTRLLGALESVKGSLSADEYKKAREAILGIVRETPSAAKGLQDVANAFVTLGIQADSVLGRIMGGVANLFSSFEKLGPSIANAFGKINIGGAGGKLGDLLKTIGGAVGKAAPFIGAALQAAGAVKAIVGGLKKLFGGDPVKKAQKEIGAIAGADISRAMAEEISKKAKDLGVSLQTATLLSLDKIIGESGRKASEFGDQIFSLMQGVAAGAIPAKEGIEAIGTAFERVREEAAAGAVESKRLMVAMIQQARAAGQVIPEIQSAVREGLSKAAGGATGAFTGIKIVSEEDARSQAYIFSATFWGIVKTDGVRAAQEALGPAWEALQKNLGEQFSGVADQILGPIRQQMELAADEVVGPILDGVAGLQDVLSGLGDTGFMTQGAFSGIQQQAQSAYQQIYNELITQGKSAEDAQKAALQSIAPLLADLQKQAAAYGIELDSNTQALIDQASASGIAFPTDPMQQVLSVLVAIGEAIGATIPENVVKAQQSMQQGMGAAGESARTSGEQIKKTMTDTTTTIKDAAAAAAGGTSATWQESMQSLADTTQTTVREMGDSVSEYELLNERLAGEIAQHWTTSIGELPIKYRKMEPELADAFAGLAETADEPLGTLDDVVWSIADGFKQIGSNATSSAGAVEGFPPTPGGGREDRGFQVGGYVPPRPGGVGAVLAEGGEGEYVLRKSQYRRLKEQARSGSGTRTSVNYNTVVQGYQRTTREIVDEMRRDFSTNQGSLLRQIKRAQQGKR